MFEEIIAYVTALINFLKDLAAMLGISLGGDKEEA